MFSSIGSGCTFLTSVNCRRQANDETDILGEYELEQVMYNKEPGTPEEKKRPWKISGEVGYLDGRSVLQPTQLC